MARTDQKGLSMIKIITVYGGMLLAAMGRTLLLALLGLFFACIIGMIFGKVGELACINRQKPVEITANGKGVRFDVYAEGSDSIIYDIEMQNAVSDSIAKRSRYSQGMIDLNLMNRGAHYKRTGK